MPDTTELQTEVAILGGGGKSSRLDLDIIRLP
jgi:hypothetical protein